MTRTALVTGATGNLGSRVIQRLINRGTHVVAVSRTGGRTADVPSGLLSSRTLDLRDSDAAADLITELSPDLVVHAAWETTHGKFWSSPDNEAWATASSAMVDAAQKSVDCRFVFISTCAEYSWGSSIPLNEEAPENPFSSYGRSKLAVTTHLRDRVDCGDLDGVSLRLFFPYGPGEAQTRLFPYVAGQIIKGEAAVIGSPEHVRDFCHIDDVADGVIAVADSSLRGVVNLGSGEGTRIGDAARMFAASIGGSHFLEAGVSEANETNPGFLVADTTRLNTVWRPSISLDEGLGHYAKDLVQGHLGNNS